jgi:hypothetical protein
MPQGNTLACPTFSLKDAVVGFTWLSILNRSHDTIPGLRLAATEATSRILGVVTLHNAFVINFTLVRELAFIANQCAITEVAVFVNLAVSRFTTLADLLSAPADAIFACVVDGTLVATIARSTVFFVRNFTGSTTDGNVT